MVERVFIYLLFTRLFACLYVPKIDLIQPPPKDKQWADIKGFIPQFNTDNLSSSTPATHQQGRFPGIYTAVCFHNFISKIHKLAKLKNFFYQLLLVDYEKIFRQAQKKRFSHSLKDFYLPYVPT